VAESTGPEVLAHVEVDVPAIVRGDVLEGLADAEDAGVVADINTTTAGRAVIVARLPPESNAQPGQPITLAVDPQKLHFFDLDGGLAIW
jgi:multiple sugar transport system ATP-binding protein